MKKLFLRLYGFLLAANSFGPITDQQARIQVMALVVGGSIVIPHLRRAVAFLDELENKND